MGRYIRCGDEKMTDKIEAIVLSEDHYNALGVIRSLGIAGIVVDLILTTTDSTFSDKSKYVRRCRKVTHAKELIIGAINEFAVDKETKYFLFPLSDYTAQLLDGSFNLFASNIFVPNMKGKMYENSNKYEMKKWARKYGVKVPEGKVFNLLNEKVNWDKYPAIIKPNVSVEGAKVDIVTVGSEEELNNNIKILQKKGYEKVLIEEFINGVDEHMIEVMGECTLNGKCSFAGIISKIREFPIKNGSTSFARVVEMHKGIDLCKLEKMIRDLKFVGLFDFEFKYANDKVYFIECNFRNGAPGFAFTKLGINLPVMWICDCLDDSLIKTKIYTRNLTFMCEQNDVINMLKRDVNIGIWIKDFIFSSKIFWFRGDFMPVLKYYYLFIKNRIRKK